MQGLPWVRTVRNASLAFEKLTGGNYVYQQDTIPLKAPGIAIPWIRILSPFQFLTVPCHRSPGFSCFCTEDRRESRIPDIAVLSNGHGIAQSANTLDLDFDRVAVSYRLRFARCASKNHVSGHQRDELRNVAEQFVGRVDQLLRR